MQLITMDLHDAARRSEDLPDDWNDKDTTYHKNRYEKFLKLIAKYPGRPFAPTRNIDRMWHMHMLSPVAYYRDCMNLFGSILDHDGGFGMMPEEETQLKSTFEETAQLWALEYGEVYSDDPKSEIVDCWHDCQGRCWHACSSKVEQYAS